MIIQKVDLSVVANRSFEAWLDLGVDNLKGVKPDPVKVYDAEFELIDPALNQNRSVLILHNSNSKFSTQAVVELENRCDYLYLLHTGFNISGSKFSIELIYNDNLQAEITIDADNYLGGEWWDTPHFAGPAWASDHTRKLGQPLCLSNAGNAVNTEVALYASTLRNPHPDKVVKRIIFHASKNRQEIAHWIIFALSCNTGRNLLALEESLSTVIEIDTGRTNGKIRCLHGTNLAAPLHGAGSHSATNISGELRALDIPLTRLHDAPLFNPGMSLVDIHHIFPFFHLDCHDPRNYYFKATDDYITNALENGTKILYRLGESIEHSKNKYFVHPPADYDKWAEICINIIAHYNEGWNNGFQYDIEYWEIWGEPDLGTALWSGSYDDYIRLYINTARKIKARFPEIKVGGPSMTRVRVPLIENFLSECRKNQAPLDFFSWHNYSSSVEDVPAKTYEVKALLDQFGYHHTELNLNEWHYFVADWGKMASDREYRKWFFSNMTGIDSASYTAGVLIMLQDSPMTMTNFYTGSASGVWGIFNSQTYMPNKVYYAIWAFNQLTKYENRLTICKNSDDGIYILAGKKDDNHAAVLISCMHGIKRKITLNFTGFQLAENSCKIQVLDDQSDAPRVIIPKITNSNITFNKPSGSAIFMLEIC